MAGEFGGEGEPARNVTYWASVEAKASEIETALQEFERLVRENISTTEPTEIKDSRLDASEQTGAEAQP